MRVWMIRLPGLVAVNVVAVAMRFAMNHQTFVSMVVRVIVYVRVRVSDAIVDVQVRMKCYARANIVDY
jgi:hypothetical protein